MNVYWLEQTQADVPLHDDWLSRFEADCLSHMLVRKRRDDWRLGRWTAKRALAVRLSLPGDLQTLAEIEIRAAASGAPEAFVANRPADATISLSHRGGIGLCAVAPAGVALGCDLEVIEPHGDGFIADYFTPEEQGCISTTATVAQSQLVSILWSAKESALKALHEGLRVDTRRVTVGGIASFDKGSWAPLEVRHCDGRIFHGWRRCAGRMVRTVVADPAPETPIAIAIKAPSLDGVFQCA